MKLIEFDGDFYNLDQLVSLTEGSPDDGPTLEREENEIVLTFAGGVTVCRPLSERERILSVLRQA